LRERRADTYKKGGVPDPVGVLLEMSGEEEDPSGSIGLRGKKEKLS